MLKNKATTRCPLVLACDEGYAMPLATTLRSIVESNQSGWPLSIYILSNGFSESLKRKIIESQPQGSCEIEWAAVDLTRFAGFSTLPHISSIAYARLLIASVLPAEVSRALYLDADLLVLDNVTALCELDLEDAVVGAVLDERLDTYIKLGNTSLAGSPLPGVRNYFNAGVLLIDLNKWRAKRIPERALEYMERCPNSLYSDQDALNAACDGSWKAMDCRWNYYQIDLEKPMSELIPAKRPGIIHFQGGQKPWDPRSLNWNASFYDGFRSRTLFARTAAQRLSDIPVTIWSRLKQVLKRSSTVRHIWDRLQLLRPSYGRGTARRQPASIRLDVTVGKTGATDGFEVTASGERNNSRL